MPRPRHVKRTFKKSVETVTETTTPTVSKSITKTLFDKEQLIKKWLHSRKVAIYILVMIVATIALFIKLLDGDHWTQVTKWATSGYMAGNALDGFSDAWKSQQGSGDGSATNGS